MKVLVFGASGRVGTGVIDFLLDQKQPVTAFVRSKRKFQKQHELLNIIEGDISKEEAIKEILGDDIKAVINTIGYDPFKPSNIVTEAARKIVRTMEKTRVSRYVGITGVAQMPNRKLAGGLTDFALRR